ncbi:MAG: nickel pincer cofactor biosynthesis protein LarC [Candidatus Firestonebacteria bacterium]
MKKILYFDCFSGISGDMILGALIDAGVSFETLNQELKKLKLRDFNLKIKKVKRGIINAVKVDVVAKNEKKHTHRRYSDIVKIIEKSLLDNEIKRKAKDIFCNLAKIESKIHGEKINEIYFHEIGGIDTIVDIVGTLICLKELNIYKVFVSPINLGGNCKIVCSHGVLPNPAPATLELLKGLPVYFSDIPFETATPTGASILSYLVDRKDKFQKNKFVVENIGYSAGSIDFGQHPNVLRVLIGSLNNEEAESDDRRKSPWDDRRKSLWDEIAVVETNIDDMSPLFYDSLIEKLFKSNALDVSLTNIHMKKNRPAIKLTVLCEKEDQNKIIEDILNETTTFGVRYYYAKRFKLIKEFKYIKTKWGMVKTKIGKLKGRIISISPEFNDCKRISKKKNIPVRIIYDEAKNMVSVPI